jgi:hypothetical protein
MDRMARKPELSLTESALGDKISDITACTILIIRRIRLENEGVYADTVEGRFAP